MRPIADHRKIGAVESWAAIRWNDPRHPLALESFGAVPAVAPVVGWLNPKWVPIRTVVATKSAPAVIFSGQQSGNLSLGVL